MTTIRMKELELPVFLPHGWKKVVARTLGIHENTITRALKRGKGETYERIVQTAKAKYGTGTNVVSES